MAVYARSDALSRPWFPPAGATRGIVPMITDVFNRPTLEERDSMYGSQNCINPIVQFQDLQNFTVWGQKTMQRTPTALDRVNVRRLMFVLEKRIRSGSLRMLFEPNDATFQRNFTTMASAILADVKLGRGLYDYYIKCDSTLNTPDVIDRNEFRAQIGIQPVKSVEFMLIEFSINRTGSWTENTEQPYTT
jgi:phage tail sheath protein FI